MRIERDFEVQFWLKNELRGRNLERENSLETLGLISDLVSLIWKMDLEDDFGHKNGWGIRFMNRFESKKSGKDEFWSEKNEGRNDF